MVNKVVYISRLHVFFALILNDRHFYTSRSTFIKISILSNKIIVKCLFKEFLRGCKYLPRRRARWLCRRRLPTVDNKTRAQTTALCCR